MLTSITTIDLTFKVYVQFKVIRCSQTIVFLVTSLVRSLLFRHFIFHTVSESYYYFFSVLDLLTLYIFLLYFKGEKNKDY